MIKIDEQEQNEMNFRSQVVDIEKVGHSRNGNPKFEITIDDMGQERTFTTRADIQVNGISEGSVIDFNISSNGNQITAVEKTDSHIAMTYKIENMEEMRNLEFIDKREGYDLAGTVETNIEGISFEYAGIGDIKFTDEAIEKINELTTENGLEGNSHMIEYDISHKFYNSELGLEIKNEVNDEIDKYEEKGIYIDELNSFYTVEDKYGIDHGKFETMNEALYKADELYIQLEALREKEARQELMYEAVQSFEPTDRDNPALTSIEFEEVMHDKGLEGKNPFASHSIDEVKSMSRDELKEASRSEPERETPDLSRKEEPAKEREKVRELER
jgi:hypothetical protein